MRLFSKHFRQIAGTTFKIDKVFKPYRQGFNKSANTMESFVMTDDGRKQKVYRDGTFALIEGKPDFKLHKKVYDVEITTEKPLSFEFRDGNKEDNKLTVTLSASMVGNMAKATVAFGKTIAQENGRDKYDWEEEYVDKLAGQYIIFSVSGEGLGTTYTFKEGKMFNLVDAKEEKKEEVKEEDDGGLPR